MSKELLEAVKLFISQPLNNPLSRGQIMDLARLALPILDQQERGEGWIEWCGGECPVTDDTLVAVKYRNGVSMPDQQAGCYEWNHGYGDLAQTRVDIIAYRIIPEQPTNQNGEH